MKQVDKHPTTQEISRQLDPVTLYDRYGSMAYGIILRIIPEPETAQTVLIDLFASPQIRSLTNVSAHSAGDIIRLARTNALAAKATLNTPTPPTPTPVANDNSPKVVFDLLFSQGYTPEAFSDNLHLSRSTVLKSIHTHFKHLRSS